MIKKTFLIFLCVGAVAVTPLVVSAATIGGILDMFLWVVLTLTQIFGVAAFAAFFYGLALFLMNHEDKTIHEKGRNIMVWGIIALFVMVTIWGLISFMVDTFGNYNGPQGFEIIVPQV